jgi:hypothetical protein
VFFKDQGPRQSLMSLVEISGQDSFPPGFTQQISP